MPSTVILLFLVACSQHLAMAADAKPPAFFLAGDSMTAVQSTGGGGWGNGFLSFLKKPAEGINYGKNGATTVSFVSGGYWSTVLSSVEDSVDEFDPYVTIMVSASFT